jgi:hypothetical protein
LLDDRSKRAACADYTSKERTWRKFPNRFSGAGILPAVLSAEDKVTRKTANLSRVRASETPA